MIYGPKIHCITCVTCALAENYTNTKFSLLHHIRNHYLIIFSKQQVFDIYIWDCIARDDYVRIWFNFLVYIKNQSISSLWHHYRGPKSPKTAVAKIWYIENGSINRDKQEFKFEGVMSILNTNFIPMFYLVF